MVVSRDSPEKKCNQTITGPTYGADYILEILGQKWGALPNFLALRNCQNLVLGKNNQVLLTIGQILGTAAENTRWLTRLTLLLHLLLSSGARTWSPTIQVTSLIYAGRSGERSHACLYLYLISVELYVRGRSVTANIVGFRSELLFSILVSILHDWHLM